jgi:predicted NAD-dependent protein-ADP-ribosyltransferase YbiA (DUF1768 family)
LIQLSGDSASIRVAVACSVVRPEADYVLKQVYLKAGKRTFVEGSSQDTIWGVGIRWGHPSIEAPKTGEAQIVLGVCHDIARDVVLENLDAEFVAK